MGNLILCTGKKAENPFYVEELDLPIYTGEELCYFIYHNRMLIENSFFGEKLFSFLSTELGMTALAEKLRRWKEEMNLADLLLIILQDIHYYTQPQLLAFQEETNRLAMASPGELMQEKADYLFAHGQFYAAIRLYDSLLFLQEKESDQDEFKGSLWFKKATALVGIYSFDRAVECYERAYDLRKEMESLRRIYEIHCLDPLARFPAERFAEIPADILDQWKKEWEEAEKKARFEGKALQAAALQEEEPEKRAAGYQTLVTRWAKEYQRSQRT